MAHVLSQADLGQFTGTMNYHRWSVLFRNMVLTDGANYVAEKAGAFWLMDAIASHQISKNIRLNPRLQDFQLWELKVNKNKGVLTCKADSGEEPVIKQKIPYTDFCLPEIKLYVELGQVGDQVIKVILLPSEH